MKENTLLLFDCYGVVVDEIAPYVFAKYLPNPEEAQRKKYEIFRLADAGEIDLQETLKRVSEALGITLEETLAEWESHYIENKELVSFIRSIQDQATIGLLSNAPSGLVEAIFERFGLFDLFDQITVSYQVHVTKPDPRIYEACLASYPEIFDRILFIDDNEKNLQNLAKFGIETLQYDMKSNAASIQKIKDWLQGGDKKC